MISFKVLLLILTTTLYVNFLQASNLNTNVKSSSPIEEQATFHASLNCGGAILRTEETYYSRIVNKHGCWEITASNKLITKHILSCPSPRIQCNPSLIYQQTTPNIAPGISTNF